LDVVRLYDGTGDQLGHYLKNQVWNADHLPRVALIGLPEGRGSRCRQIAEGPDAIRAHLYTLAAFAPETKIFDLGNIKCGKELKDTYAALKMVAEELSMLGIPLLILGGSQELTVPLIKGLNKPELNLVMNSVLPTNFLSITCLRVAP
jgi:formiminoglutamase